MIMCNIPFVYLILILTISLKANSSIYQNYAKLFNPQDYLQQLPSLSLPYKNNIPIPSVNIPLIKPSRVATKVINVVTEYVTKNPVCIKVKGKKHPCEYKNTSYKVRNRNFEQPVHREYFVAGKRDYTNTYRTNKLITEDLLGSEYSNEYESVQETPFLESKIKDILIEQRLDHLKNILPYYGANNYETETITVTRQLTNKKKMATLVVTNCIPKDIDHMSTSLSRKALDTDNDPTPGLTQLVCLISGKPTSPLLDGHRPSKLSYSESSATNITQPAVATPIRLPGKHGEENPIVYIVLFELQVIKLC
ncbi:hypothetical protein FQA39_LY08691 [Lamprigera yunnana]|nr:hypothetical protein FQA39_LY08691 [Lamprigera yunnana]